MFWMISRLERLGVLGIGDKEALQTQLDNLCLDNDYLTALKILKNRIEREDL